MITRASADAYKGAYVSFDMNVLRNFLYAAPILAIGYIQSSIANQRIRFPQGVTDDLDFSLFIRHLDESDECFISTWGLDASEHDEEHFQVQEFHVLSERYGLLRHVAPASGLIYDGHMIRRDLSGFPLEFVFLLIDELCYLDSEKRQCSYFRNEITSMITDFFDPALSQIIEYSVI